MTTSGSEDTGEADAVLRRLIAEHAAGEGSADRVLTALASARLVVPVVPSPTVDGEMAWVQTTGRDGRIGMLAFTGVDALAQFDPSARPMPMRAGEVAAAALQTGASALVVDIAGPALFAVEELGLEALARLRSDEET